MLSNLILFICTFLLFIRCGYSHILRTTLDQQDRKCWNGVDKFAVICYYTDWSINRQGKARYVAENLENAPCTHILYSFALLSDTTKDSIVPAEPEFDLGKEHLYQRVTALKNETRKVILSLGGWVDSTPKYSIMMADPNLRAKVVRQTTEYLAEHNFDGLDVAIVHPNAYQNVLHSGSEKDKENYVLFLRELREAFDFHAKSSGNGRRLSLSVSASLSEEIVDIAYDVDAVSEIVDWISVTSYNFNGMDDKVTGLSAPFSVQPGDFGDHRKYNVESTMNMWLEKGAPSNKLVLGMATFGTRFLLKDMTRKELKAPAGGEPKPAKHTGYTRVFSFFEILENVQNDNWTAVHHNFLGSYAYSEREWVSYDDAFDIAVKSMYSKLNCFYGVSFWSLDLDCFQDDCPNGPYSLIRTAAQVLGNVKSLNDVRNFT